MIDYVLKSKTRSVQRMMVSHLGPEFLYHRSFVGYCMNCDSDSYVLLTHYLFRLIMVNKSTWVCLPTDSSAINFVLRHLRFMLTNLDSDEIKDYALSNLFVKDGNSEISSSKVG